MLYLSEIYIVNLLGIMLLVGMMASGAWKLANRYESNMLLYMIVVVLMSCVIDSICTFSEGKQGATWFYIVYLCYFWFFTANLIMGPAWVFLINHHINGSNPRWLGFASTILVIIGFIVLLANVIKPIVFEIDIMNIYHRRMFFWLFNGVSLTYVVLGMVLYIHRRLHFQSMRFFPVFQFFIPVVFGLLVQGINYGLSVIWPACSVGLAVMLISLQNEKVYMDQLTGLYNRDFLDKVERERAHRGRFIMMMLDMNEFKAINDNYGHSEGDQALITVGQILSEIVPRDGLVIRYAGDEFFALFSGRTFEDGEVIQKRIEERFKKYNESGIKPYRLTGSIGFGVYDLSNTTMDTILKDIDKRMYEQKEVYYKHHERRHDRRGA